MKPEMASTVGEEIVKEMARVRDELLPVYVELGPAGAFGAMMLRSALDRAAAALASGDVVAIIRAYEELKGCE
jgi:hypothetical protein